MNRTRSAPALAMAALAAILLPSCAHALVTFERTYGSTAGDFARSVVQIPDGGYYVAGTTSYGSGDADIYVLAIDQLGELRWTHAYGGNQDDYGYSVACDADGGFIVAGVTWSFGVSPADANIYIVRADSSGDTLRTIIYGDKGDDYASSAQRTVDGGFMISGLATPPGDDADNSCLIKMDAECNTQWIRTYDRGKHDHGDAVTQTRDSGYAICGMTWSPGASEDIWLVRTHANGDTLWTRTYGGDGADDGFSVEQTTDGGFILCGQTESFGAGSFDTWLIRTDSVGDTLWTRTLGGGGDDRGYSVQQTTDGGYVIAGYTESYGAGGTDVWLIKTNTRGDTLWTRTFGGAKEDKGYSVQQTADGGYIIAGTTASFGAGGSDVYLIKTDSLGSVAVAEPKANPTRMRGLTLTCEPNPCRTRTAISLQLPANSPAELAVFDASGRCVRTFTVSRTPYTAWDGRNDAGQALPSGAYFVRLDAGDRHASARIVLQR